MKKIAMFLFFTFMVGTLAFVGAAMVNPAVAEASITDRLDLTGGDGADKLQQSIDEAGTKIVDTAREIGLIVMFILIIWIGYTLWFSGSSQGIAQMKGRVGALFLALVFVFFTEEIMGFVFGILGKDLNF